jgi:RecJ-like exonuclease
MLEKISDFAKDFIEKTKYRDILIVSHFDADGITSAAILGRALKKLDLRFSFNIVKGLEPEFIDSLPEDKIILFTDLASGSLHHLSKLSNPIFIIDHHEIKLENYSQIPENIKVLNPHLFNAELMSGACLTYLFSRELIKKDSFSANLALIGMVGDLMEKNIGPLVNTILREADLTIKKGFLLYPSTRPLNKALEYCSNPYICGVTGNSAGALNLLREAQIPSSPTGYKSLIELNEEEMQRLVTSIALRMPNHEHMKEFIGNLFLIKFFNKLEDARELSALINACSRMNESNIALLLCLGNENARKQAEAIYIRYKQSLIEALNHVHNNPKIEGKQYVIMNAQDKIQDTIIGTVASIISMSALYEEGKVIITMAYNKDKIKVSSRICGRDKISNCPNLKEIMDSIIENLGSGESGGHKMAAGCIISKDKEEAFIDLIRKKLEMEIIKI